MVKRMDAMSSLVREGSLVELVRGDFEVKQLVESNSLFHRVVQFERELILDALVAALWNKSRAARELGIHESTLRAKMKRFMIDEPNGQPPKRNIA